jgi:hypothetical protein
MTYFSEIERKYVLGAYMFRYGLRRRTKVPSQRPAVITVGIKAALMEANEVELGVYARVRYSFPYEIESYISALSLKTDKQVCLLDPSCC